MSQLIAQYTKEVTDLMQVIAKEEEANILAAAEILSDKVVEGRLINIFGAGGHSAIAAMEIFWRAGGLAQVNAMFPRCGGRLQNRPFITIIARFCRLADLFSKT